MMAAVRANPNIILPTVPKNALSTVLIKFVLLLMDHANV